MKKLEHPLQERPAAKPRLEPAALQRLGTLREMTRTLMGTGLDGGMGGNSFG